MLTPIERANRMESLILKRLGGSQAQIAANLGISESSISRLKGDHLNLFCNLLAQIGIKAVPVEKRCFDESEIAAYLTLARKHMEHTESVESLGREDD